MKLNLSRYSIHAWLQENGVKTERGLPIDMRKHKFLFEIFRDFSKEIVVMKGAQVGMSNTAVDKMFWVAETKKLDIIYTLPTFEDVRDFVSGKVDRIIDNNESLQKSVQDRDNVTQKKVGNSMIYFRGTYTEKAAQMIPADLLIHDEIDTSKAEVINSYDSRLQHSDYKWKWIFSHPSVSNFGVHSHWLNSDQKHWVVTCKKCEARQYLEFPRSIKWLTKEDDPACKASFVCKKCGEVLDDDTRIDGEWVKFADSEVSGYWIPLLICPWVSATDIVRKYYLAKYTGHSSIPYFYNKVLGLPYDGNENTLSKDSFMRAVSTRQKTDIVGRVIIGLDVGKMLHYVVGDSEGIFYYDEVLADESGWKQIEGLLQKYSDSILMVDSMPDMYNPQRMKEMYPGRVFTCSFQKSKESRVVRFATGEDHATVTIDKDKMLDMLQSEIKDKRLLFFGTRDEWEDYYEHWSVLYKVIEEDPQTGKMEFTWHRKIPVDHWCFTAGTKIITDQGEKNIEDIQVGSRVLTRKGFKYVKWTSSREEEVIQNVLEGTKDHPILTKESGFKDLIALVYSDTVFTCHLNKFYLTVLCFVDTLIRRIEPSEFTTYQTERNEAKELEGFMKRFIKPISVLYRKVLQYIIETTIHLIIRQRTWKQCHELSIKDNTIRSGSRIQRIGRKIWNTLEGSRFWLIRSHVKKVNIQNGERKSLEGFSNNSGLKSQENLYASFAGTMEKQNHQMEENSVHENVHEFSFLENGEKNIQTTKKGTRKIVYNFEVEDAHEYFANGILVSNCMGTVYYRAGRERFTETRIKNSACGNRSAYFIEGTDLMIDTSIKESLEENIRVNNMRRRYL